jgi:hypothetical protein
MESEEIIMSEEHKLVQLIKVYQTYNDKGKPIIVKILKDEETGEKYSEILEDPKITYYMTNFDELSDDTIIKKFKIPVAQISDKKVDEFEIEYSNLYSDMVNRLPGDIKMSDIDPDRYKNYNGVNADAIQMEANMSLMQYYKHIRACKKIISDRNRKNDYFDSDTVYFGNKNLKSIHSLPVFHGTDMNLEDFYIGKHYEKYPLENSKGIITKGYFDIECYTENYQGFPEPEKAECPVDIIGYFDDVEHIFYGYFYNNPEVSTIRDFLYKDNELDSERITNFANRMVQKYKDKYNINIKMNLEWFDDELELIRAFFQRVNTNRPDFISGWNICGFDIPYLINRVKNLIKSGKGDNYCVNDILCDQELREKLSKHHKCTKTSGEFFSLTTDKRNQDFADKNDYYLDLSYVNWVDSLLLFANLRKIFGKRESYELDAIVKEELDESKEDIDPENKGITIKNIVRKDYEHYIEYNIHDVMLLFLLEEKNNDLDQLYSVASMTETRIHKCLKKTVCLKNLARKFYKEQGYILSNNHNVKYDGSKENSKESFRGALTPTGVL